MRVVCLGCGAVVAGDSRTGGAVAHTLCENCRGPLRIDLPITEKAVGSPAPTTGSGDPICEDCQSHLSEHTGAGGANPWTACKVFMPEGPKQ